MRKPILFALVFAGFISACSGGSESLSDSASFGADVEESSVDIAQVGGDAAEAPSDPDVQAFDTSGDPPGEDASGDVPGDAPQSSWDEVGALIEEKMATAHIVGLAVAVTRPGEVVWRGAYGLANLETQKPVTVDTPFMLASVSKTLTAAAIMHAQEAGALNLDEEINSVLPFIVDNPQVDGEVIRTRHLVSHTSGIRDNWANMPYADGDSPHELGAYLEGYLVEGGAWYHADKNFYENMPGVAREYGNIATALAGYVLEVTTQTSFDAYCDTHIFQVLGMDDTGWHLADFDPSSVAMPYEYVGGAHEAVGHYGYADYPDGQLRSSVSDMARFLAAVSNSGVLGEARILASETVAEMFAPQFPGVDDGQFVFWYRATAAGRSVIGHNGGDKGVATEMVFSPETGVGVIILMNVAWANGVGDAATVIQDLLFERAEAL